MPGGSGRVLPEHVPPHPRVHRDGTGGPCVDRPGRPELLDVQHDVTGREHLPRQARALLTEHEHHHPSVADLVAWAGSAGTDGTGIPLVGIDNVPGSVALETYDLPRECVLVLGQEGPGLTPEMLAACDVVLHIEQFGSTRSINAGAAGAVAMHAWVRRHVFGQRVTDAHDER